MKCDFFLQVKSQPIIEHCTETRFAPYALTYPGLPAQLKAAALEGIEGLGMWRAVNDFNWHKVQQSPNWSIIPDSERVTVEFTAEGAVVCAATCREPTSSLPTHESTSATEPAAECDDEL